MDRYPQFAALKAVYVCDNNRVMLHVTHLQTKCFLSHFHAYQVSTTSVSSVVCVHNLCQPYPLHIHILHIDNVLQQVIVPKHFIPGTLQV